MKLTFILLFTISEILTAQISSEVKPHFFQIRNEKKTNFNSPEKITWYQMFSKVPGDEIGFFSRNFRQNKIPLYLSAALLTGALISFDHNSWEITRNAVSRSPFLKGFSDYSVMLGNGGVHFVIAGMFASFGLLTHDNRAVKTASNITEAVLATGLFVQVLKRLTGRESPASATYKSGIWDLFPGLNEYQGNQAKYYSFPSGHLSTATAALTVIANNYPDVKWIKPVGYSLLGLLSLTLVSKGMHWYSDLPLAFIIGNSMGNIIAPVKNYSASNDAQRSDSRLTVIPDLDKNAVGLDMVYSF